MPYKTIPKIQLAFTAQLLFSRAGAGCFQMHSLNYVIISATLSSELTLMVEEEPGAQECSCRSWKCKETDASLASGGSAAHWHWSPPSKTDFIILTSRSIRESTCVVLTTKSVVVCHNSHRELIRVSQPTMHSQEIEQVLSPGLLTPNLVLLLSRLAASCWMLCTTLIDTIQIPTEPLLWHSDFQTWLCISSPGPFVMKCRVPGPKDWEEPYNSVFLNRGICCRFYDPIWESLL